MARPIEPTESDSPTPREPAGRAGRGSSSVDPLRRRLIRAGIGIFAAGILIAIAGAALLGSRRPELESVGQILHRTGMVTTLAGLLVLLSGHRANAMRQVFRELKRTAQPSRAANPPQDDPRQVVSPSRHVGNERQPRVRTGTPVLVRDSRFSRIRALVLLVGLMLIGTGAALLPVNPALDITLFVSQMLVALTLVLFAIWDREYGRAFSIGALAGQFIAFVAHVEYHPFRVVAIQTVVFTWLSVLLFGGFAVLLRAILFVRVEYSVPEIPPSDSGEDDEDR